MPAQAVHAVQLLSCRHVFEVLPYGLRRAWLMSFSGRSRAPCVAGTALFPRLYARVPPA